MNARETMCFVTAWTLSYSQCLWYYLLSIFFSPQELLFSTTWWQAIVSSDCSYNTAPQ